MGDIDEGGGVDMAYTVPERLHPERFERDAVLAGQMCVFRQGPFRIGRLYHETVPVIYDRLQFLDGPYHTL